MNMQELKAAGYTIKINHYRPFKTYWHHPHPNHERKVERIVYLPRYHKRNKDFYLMSRGGYTTLSIYKDNKLAAESLAICSDNDVFCFQAGVDACFKKIKL